MAFSFNPAKEQQLSLWDSYESLTPREKRFLDKSWAKIFAEKIFPKIDEAPYAVLYSDVASRPNTVLHMKSRLASIFFMIPSLPFQRKWLA